MVIITIDTILIFIAIVIIILNLIIIIIIVFNTSIIISILIYGKKFIKKVSFCCAFCFSWIIEPGYISNITVTFHDFDLEFSKTCEPYDSVRVLEKCNKSKTWEIIEKNVEGYCGNRKTFDITSQCERMKIEFKSDDSVTGRGFNATYVITPKPSKSEQSALKLILRTKQCTKPQTLILNYSRTKYPLIFPSSFICFFFVFSVFFPRLPCQNCSSLSLPLPLRPSLIFSPFVTLLLPSFNNNNNNNNNNK